MNDSKGSSRTPARPETAPEPLSRRLWRIWRKAQVWRYNPVRDLRFWLDLKVLRRPIADLFPYERHVLSQHGEDGIFEAIFEKIGTTGRYFVEFGAGNGLECNTALLRTKGWDGLWMDGNSPHPLVKKEFITAENINELFAKHGVPDEFDLLSIDVDGNDYWIWKAIAPRHRPRVVVMEFNGNYPPEERKTIPYEPTFQWDHWSDYYGATLGAFESLAQAKGYVLVGCDSSGVNAFFVRKDCAEGRFVQRSLKDLYRAPIYGKRRMGQPRHPEKNLVPAS